MNATEQLAALRANGHHRQAELLARIVAGRTPTPSRRASVAPLTAERRAAATRLLAAGVPGTKGSGRQT